MRKMDTYFLRISYPINEKLGVPIWMKTGRRIGDLEIVLQNLSVIQKVNIAENSLMKTVTILKSFGKP